MGRTAFSTLVQRIDLRFVLGIGLVLASVIGVVALIQSLNHTVSVYVISTTVPTGSALTRENLRIEQVNLGTSSGQYVHPGDDINGLFAQRPLESGEFVAKSALARAGTDAMVSTVISVTGALPESVRVGSAVDVWAAPTESTRVVDPVEPAVVLADVEVQKISTSGGFAAADGTNVELRIPRTKLEGVLLAQAMGLGFTIVSVGGGQ